jgi:1-aminocyclopropane-1-carboxylate deaminase
LAYEIFHFWSLQGNGLPLSVFVPGGTCTTALWVHQELQTLQATSCLDALVDIQVTVIPCVGDDGYAERQMMALNMATGGKGNVDEIPKVLKPAPDSSFYLQEINRQSYFRFGDPNSEILETFRELESCGLNVDLLYGAPSWNILLRHWPLKDEENVCNRKFMDGRKIMYVHSGGLEGVNSQLMRYRHAGLIEGEEVQHPERQRWSSKTFLEKNIE